MRDRVELAVEHALRNGLISLADLRIQGGGSSGDRAIREIARLRGDEPATESYAETRAVQRLRQFDWTPWRQAHVGRDNRIEYRVDFVLPFRPGAKRPNTLRPSDGLLIEVDGREIHEPLFERDHVRGNVYDQLGFHWTSLTPSQIEHTPLSVRAASRVHFAGPASPSSRPAPVESLALCRHHGVHRAPLSNCREARDEQSGGLVGVAARAR